MNFDPIIHHRESIRLNGYDYSKAGLYFVTICTQNKKFFFGEIIDEQMKLNLAGEMINKWWCELTNKYPLLKLHEAAIMPNHFHGIIEITKNNPDLTQPSLSEIIQWFKAMTTNEYIKGVKQNNWQRFEGKLWQRNYYEHIIRDRQDYLNVVDYIKENPAKWKDDEYF